MDRPRFEREREPLDPDSPEYREQVLALAFEKRLAEDIAWSVSQPQVRRFLQHLLEETCRLLWEHPEGEAGQRAEGRRAVGLQIQRCVRAVDPALLIRMQQEYLADPELPKTSEGAG